MKLKQLTLALLMAFGLAANAQNTIQKVEQVTGTVTLTEAIDYTITSSSEPFTTMASIDIQNTDATVVFENIRPSVVLSQYLSKINSNGKPLVNGTNARVSIYRHGSIVFAHSDTKNADATPFYPVVMCSDDNCEEVIAGYNTTNRVISGPWKDAARSFILKRGYMCTVANEANGTGYSHCYIANSADRKITLNKYLAGKLGFFRIFRWQWPTKLGMSDARAEAIRVGTNSSWFYDWGGGRSSQTDAEYVPQRHHEAGNSNSEGYKGAWESWANLNASDNTCTHILGQNEPDNTSGKGEVYTYVTAIPSEPRTNHGDYPLVDVAKEFLYSGKRIGTFACCNPNTGWVTEYINWCRQNNIRVDFVATHYYIGGQSPQGCIDRLKTLYTATGLPVWVTEWNNGANWTTESGFTTDSEGWYTWGSGNDQYKNGVWLKDVLVRADKSENKWLERLAVYNAVESKRQIESGGSLTDGGKVLGTYHSGFAYTDGNEYFMPWTYKDPTNLTFEKYNAAAKKVTISWTHNNSKQSNSICVQRKLQGGSYETVEDIGLHENGTITYTDDVTGLAGTVYYRICDIGSDNKSRYTNEVTVNVDPAQGIDGFQYGNLRVSTTEDNTVNYATSFPDANHRLFIGILSNENPTFTLGNVTSNTTGKNNFKYRILPWNSNNANLASAIEVPFLALNDGHSKFGDLDYEVGNCQANKASDNAFTEVTEVTFQQAFPEGVTPVVLTEVANNTAYANATSTNKATALSVRVFDITNTGFKFIIYPEEASGRKITTKLNVNYLAITPGLGTVDEESDIMIAAGIGTDSKIYGTAVKDNTFRIETGTDGEKTTEEASFYNPVILADLQTNNYPSLAMLRRINMTERIGDKTWVKGIRVKRTLESTITDEDGKKVLVSTNNEKYQDELGWVVIAKVTEGGTVPTAITDLTADPSSNGKLRVRIVDGRLYVDGAATFEVYTASGAQVSATSALTPGIYVVKANGKSGKVLVK